MSSSVMCFTGELTKKEDIPFSLQHRAYYLRIFTSIVSINTYLVKNFKEKSHWMIRMENSQVTGLPMPLIGCPLFYLACEECECDTYPDNCRQEWPSEARVAMLRLLAYGAKEDDIVLILHMDRKDHSVMNYAQSFDRLTVQEQESLALLVSV